MDREAQQVTVRRVEKSWTRLSDCAHTCREQDGAGLLRKGSDYDAAHAKPLQARPTLCNPRFSVSSPRSPDAGALPGYTGRETLPA